MALKYQKMNFGKIQSLTVTITQRQQNTGRFGNWVWSNSTLIKYFFLFFYQPESTCYNRRRHDYFPLNFFHSYKFSKKKIVLGGFGSVSSIDIAESRKFLLNCFTKLNLSKKKGSHSRSLDCGAGIGRITQDLLQDYYAEVHLLEVAKPLLDKAKRNLKACKAEFFCESMHTFEPTCKYDVAWCQVL